MTPMGSGGRMHWTDEELKRLVEMRAAGLLYKQIAERQGVSEGAAVSKGKQLGLHKPRKTAHEA